MERNSRSIASGVPASVEGVMLPRMHVTLSREARGLAI
jgi:hypothetical protein